MTDAQSFIEKNLESAESSDTQSRPLMRFSLLGMMAVTTMLAVVCALVFALPPSIGAVVCIFLQPCVIAAFVIGTFAGTEDLRAFSIGGLVPFAQSVLPGGAGMGNWSNWLTVMITQRSFNSGRRRPSSNDSVFEFIGNIFSMLENIGPALMLSMFVFLFASICCGFTAVFVRRWIAKRSAETNAVA